MAKKIICLCEDITLDEIEDAIRKGYKDIESLKRYTGFSTGACQGKTCISMVLRTLAFKTGKKPEELFTTTLRQPIQPIPLETLAGEEDEG
ncbi:MAG: (2Fe-2S)-binding protein [Candidatus Methanofastidiosia archaeon]